MIMKKCLFSFAVVLLGAVLVLPSCSKDDSSDGGKISYQVKPTNFTASVASNVSGSGLIVTVNSNSSLT